MSSGGERKWCNGQALVEFALVAPILFVLILGIIEAGRFIFYYHSLNNGIREGARYAIVHGENAFDRCPSGPLPPGSNANNCDPAGDKVREAVRRGSFGLNPSGFTYGWPGDPRFPLYFHADGSPNGSNVSGNNVLVRVEYAYTALIPIDFLPDLTIRSESKLVINN